MVEKKIILQKLVLLAGEQKLQIYQMIDFTKCTEEQANKFLFFQLNLIPDIETASESSSEPSFRMGKEAIDFE